MEVEWRYKVGRHPNDNLEDDFLMALAHEDMEDEWEAAQDPEDRYLSERQLFRLNYRMNNPRNNFYYIIHFIRFTLLLNLFVFELISK